MVCSSADDLLSQQLPCQDAVAQIYSRFSREPPASDRRDRERDRDERERERERERAAAPVRMLIPPNHVGCILGKGGATISALRRETGATIKVVKGESVPRGVSADPGDELVEIGAEPSGACTVALWRILQLLRQEMQRHQAGAGAGGGGAGAGAGVGIPMLSLGAPGAFWLFSRATQSLHRPPSMFGAFLPLHAFPFHSTRRGIPPQQMKRPSQQTNRHVRDQLMSHLLSPLCQVATTAAAAAATATEGIGATGATAAAGGAARRASGAGGRRSTVRARRTDVSLPFRLALCFLPSPAPRSAPNLLRGPCDHASSDA